MLLQRFSEDRDPALRQALAERFLPLVRSLARRYAHTSEPLEDIFQVGAVGLLNAIDRYDPDKGTAFSSFAVPTILGEIKRYFRDRTWNVRVPRGLQELAGLIEHHRARRGPTVPPRSPPPGRRPSPRRCWSRCRPG